MPLVGLNTVYRPRDGRLLQVGQGNAGTEINRAKTMVGCRPGWPRLLSMDPRPRRLSKASSLRWPGRSRNMRRWVATLDMRRGGRLHPAQGEPTGRMPPSSHDAGGRPGLEQSVFITQCFSSEVRLSPSGAVGSVIPTGLSTIARLVQLACTVLVGVSLTARREELSRFRRLELAGGEVLRDKPKKKAQKI